MDAKVGPLGHMNIFEFRLHEINFTTCAALNVKCKIRIFTFAATKFERAHRTLCGISARVCICLHLPAPACSQ